MPIIRCRVADWTLAAAARGTASGQASATLPCMPASIVTAAGPAEQDGQSGWGALAAACESWKVPSTQRAQSSCIPDSPPRYLLADPASPALSAGREAGFGLLVGGIVVKEGKIMGEIPRQL